MPSTDGLSADVLTVIARLNRWVSSHAALPVPTGQARLLALVGEIEDARISELAQADHCSQPTMTVQLQRLQDAGYVERRVDPDDKRAQRIKLTPAGREALAAMRAERQAVLDPWLSTLPSEEQRTLAEAATILEGLTRRMAAKASHSAR
ncbi:MarR family transcriptional regulator [Mycobacterium sp. CBMA271]|uniref:MarR family winged helix-turn-helix transcriptional regulator n=1 Tax=unclassified Mycobacteroides TaxID=2618759 RepID=UPI0013256E26|nr:MULTISPECIES: MarR family transcriptional regulator [unclassified Mycobacteroides]MUM18027.1 MarR family transcriptional regulator [Mycobacteroides sp. CBMA 326]MUM23492.1 MarR family transcriptional regulator [Mycobacteroides sp. CBMA 271]